MIDWKQVKPYDFQKIIGKLYENLGFEVLVCKQTRDGGVDVYARKYYYEYGRPHLCVIQAKNYARKKVGIEEVQRLKGVLCTRNADVGIVVTTSDFTDLAKEEAMKQKNIELVSRISLERNLAEAGLVDLEDIDLDPNPSDLLFQMKTTLQILEGSQHGTRQTRELMDKVKSVFNKMNEKTFFDITNRLAKINRIALNHDSISYVPSLREKAELELRIKTVVSGYAFPFDQTFLSGHLSKNFNLTPNVIDMSFNLAETLFEFVRSGQIMASTSNVYVPSPLFSKLISRIQMAGHASEYDIHDLTDDFLKDSIRTAKKYYCESSSNFGTAEDQVSRNFNLLSSYLEGKFEDGKTVIISTDYERFLLVNDRKILEVTETLATTTEDNGISMENAMQLLKTNFEPNEQILKLVIYKICSKHKAHIPQHKLRINENYH